MADDILDTWPAKEVRQDVIYLLFGGHEFANWVWLQIVYTAIVGLVMLAAILEWFLWLAAFMYCLWKVFKKAEHWTVQVLAVIVGTAFFLLRYVGHVSPKLLN